MNVDQVYQIMKLACSKNIQQGYLSPDDLMNSINMAQRSYLDYLLGEYQQYKAQRPIPVVGFSQNERVRDSMAPLIYNTILNVNTTTGIAPFPSDYEYVDNMWGLYGYYNIRFAQQDRQDSYIHSEIDSIEENPIYLIQHEGFHFFPEDIGQTKMSYVRNPPAIVWGYQLDFNGIPQYDPTTSQNPIWSDTDMLQIIVRALAIEGVSMQFGAVLKYAQDVKNNGQ